MGAKILDRHAYLIIAHKDDLCFRTLLTLLDDEHNDIYIHMDAKNVQYDADAVEMLLHKSNVVHVKRERVLWGDVSQIRVELKLLECAVKHGPHFYYHLLSGQDLPIKQQDFIHDFFAHNAGKEFVRFNKTDFTDGDRVYYSHWVWGRFGRSKSDKLIRVLDYASMLLQKKLGRTRWANVSFQKGTNWFSITEDLATYILSYRKWIEEVFSDSLCGDELFVQTLVHNSDFRNRLYWTAYDNDCRAIQRLIDWDRGNPYVFQSSDFEELASSQMLFARKFDAAIDSEIILAVRDKLAS